MLSVAQYYLERRYARGSSREAQAPTPLQRLRSQAAEWRAGAQTARTGQIR